MILTRTSKHTLSHTNVNKLKELHSFIKEYKNAVQQYINHMWHNPVHNKRKDHMKIFDRTNNELECPKFIDYNLIKFPTKLSVRALSSAATQSCGMIKAATEKRKRQLYILNKLKKEGKPTEKLEKKIQKFSLVKPSVPEDFRVELSSKCCSFEPSQQAKHFSGWLRLKSLGEYNSIIMPIKWTKHSNRLKKKKFELLGSFLFYKNNIDIRWRKKQEQKKQGATLGCDPWVTDVLTFSNHMKLPEHPHKHTYKSILEKLSKKRRGSKGFKRTSDHRRNFINWAFKRLDFNTVKEVRLEDNGWLHYKSFAGRMLGHNSWSLVKDRLRSVLESNGVRLRLMHCAFRSQRCSSCGWVQESNRKKKEFFCLNCSYADDSDYNSSLNQLVDLPLLGADFRKLKLSIDGFFWLPGGVFNKEGQEIMESLVPKKAENKDFI